MSDKLSLVIERTKGGERMRSVDLTNAGLDHFPEELLQLSDCLEELNLGGGNSLSSLKEEARDDEDAYDALSDEYSDACGGDLSPLSAEQAAAAAMVLSSDKSVFITGSAGTGKSFLLRHIIEKLKAQCAEDLSKVAVTASTGIAAATISGTTLHSFAGIGYFNPSKDRNDCKSTAQDNWKSVQYLIIDEISMISAELFDALEKIARTVRQNDSWFGGVKLIMCGDFYQLPPVSTGAFDAMFAFEAESWSDSNITTVQLREVLRQRTDQVFADILKEIREGHLSDRAQKLLDGCHASVKDLPKDTLAPTKLFCRNVDVDQENDSQLKALKGEERVFLSVDTWLYDPASEAERNQHLQGMSKKARERLAVKLSSPVILTRNMPMWGLVNGSRGEVIGFSAAEEDGDKSQSQHVTVRFENGQVVDVTPATANYSYRLRRRYIPLRLAWALTIHKSQGLSLPKAVINLTGAFASGQAYVALSRVESLEGLWLIGDKLTPSVIFAHPAVLDKFATDVDSKARNLADPPSKAQFASRSNPWSANGTSFSLPFSREATALCTVPQPHPKQPWPAITKRGTECLLCIEKGQDNFCHHHIILPSPGPASSIFLQPYSNLKKQWPAITKRGTECLLCIDKGPNNFCDFH